ncbi:hypothetical protein, partial [Paraburkholderia hospita]|uniref:hypothetical protein n=1 Tax=Paraburkholderia hospita TaxID=169430 RepID=UPI001A997B5D
MRFEFFAAALMFGFGVLAFALASGLRYLLRELRRGVFTFALAFAFCVFAGIRVLPSCFMR